MKIGFASNDWSRSAKDLLGRPIMGGSGYARIGQFIKHFRNIKVDAVVGILAFNSRAGVFGVHSWDGNDWFDCDIIVMQRYMHKNVIKDLEKAKTSGQIILQDVDDWYWGLSRKNHAFDASDPSKNPDENIIWYENIIKSSHGVLTSTPFLFKKISQWNDNVRLQTNYVDTNMFREPYLHTLDKKFVVGWMGSTAHRSGDLGVIKPVSSEISQFATWHHTGHLDSFNVPKFHKEIGVSPGIVSYMPFIPPYELNTGIKFDVGIVPLTNVPFNHAKSYIKGLEYAAAGVPFVCSWSPQYKELTEEHGIGVLANNSNDYVSLLKKFKDPEYRKHVGTDYREKVRKFDASIGAENLRDNIFDMSRQVK